jgi:hypothetical protein
MSRFLSTAFGTAVGTLLYSRFLSDAHQLDWERACFVGLLAGVIGAIWSLFQPKKKREQ